MSVEKTAEYNLEEYENPQLYDMENKGTEEVDFLRKWAQKIGITGTESFILDVACGTGRVTLPFVEAGYALIGIDIHEGMLEQAQRKTPNGAAVRWLQQDCTQLSVGEPVSLAYTVGHSFQHFLTNELQDRLLRGVRSAMTDEGIFIFDTRYPSDEELLQPAEEAYWRTITDEQGRKCDVSTKMVYDQMTQIQHYVTIRRSYELDKLVEERSATIDLRYTYPQEIERTLRNNGFELLHIYADWKETPLHQGAYDMIVVARATASRI
ncbi:class I SAM-dependent methyltransferase [Paenibacillus sp. 481]|uniref:class I SAM-dependent methyltransferase n=1 Tax=Paenibacillus sp. 481 TaxID=2835869 RepID=UPI001E3BFC60|nr:class I SAM-dependent methyltransferase [Paenibacillus sp. 481]UHA72759.1 class I SAM-dependent methyltransferase [Paenibacillus sp. 481]